MRVFGLIVGLAILVSSPSLARADFDAGTRAYEAGAFHRAYLEWKPLAEAGNARAESALGLLYLLGKGVEEDRVKARYWLARASDKGVTAATIALGTLRSQFGTSPQDREAGCDLLESTLATPEGADDARAHYAVGLCYDTGQGRQVDYEKAAEHLLFASHMELAEAQAMLAFMYALGNGVPQNDVIACMWTMLAQDNNFAFEGGNPCSAVTMLALGLAFRGRALADAWRPDPIVMARPPR